MEIVTKKCYKKYFCTKYLIFSSPVNIKDESLSDVICPWNLQKIKKEEPNLETVEAGSSLLIPQVLIKTEVDNFSEDVYKEEDFSISGDHFLTPGSSQELIDQKIACKGCDKLFVITKIQNHIHQFGHDHCKEQYTETDIEQLKKLSKERKKVTDKLRYEANKEKLQERGRKYYEKNKDKFKERHLLQSQEKNHICTLCEKTFVTAGTLKQHVLSVHEGIKIHKKVVCDTCGKEFSRPSILKKHVRIIHEGVKDQECKYCGKVFAEQNTLKNHIKSIHEKIKDHSCEICGKSFTFNYTLKEHIKSVHESEGVKGIPCDICGQELKTPKSLKDHIKFVHDKIKDHKCQDCGKAFHSASYLQKHVQCVHEKRRDFECEICGKAFSRMTDKKRHIDCVHHGKIKEQLPTLLHKDFI